MLIPGRFYACKISLLQFIRTIFVIQEMPSGEICRKALRASKKPSFNRVTDKMADKTIDGDWSYLKCSHKINATLSVKVAHSKV